MRRSVSQRELMSFRKKRVSEGKSRDEKEKREEDCKQERVSEF